MRQASGSRGVLGATQIPPLPSGSKRSWSLVGKPRRQVGSVRREGITRHRQIWTRPAVVLRQPSEGQGQNPKMLCGGSGTHES